jgi:tetratricopeptide (TPR) repeat protein
MPLDRAAGCRIASTKWTVDADHRGQVLLAIRHSFPGSIVRGRGKFDPKLMRTAILHGRLWEATMRYQRWLVLTLLSPLAIPAHAQRSAQGAGLSAGSVHVHVVYADDRRTGANLRVVLMQGSSGTPIATTFTNDNGKADFRSVAVGEYHVVVSGNGIETTTSEQFEVDARQVTQSEYVTVRKSQSSEGKTAASQPGTVSASELMVPEKARKQLDKANEAIARQDWNEAMKLLNEAIVIYPQYAMAYNNLGVVYARMNDAVREQQALEKAVSLDEHFAPACQNLVKVYLRQRAYSQAETLLGKSLSADPNNSQYLMLMADVQYMEGHYDAAISDAQKVHALANPHPSIVHYIAAKAYQQENRQEQALAEFQTFLKEEPTGPRADHVRSDMAKLQSAARSVAANAQ